MIIIQPYTAVKPLTAVTHACLLGVILLWPLVVNAQSPAPLAAICEHHATPLEALYCAITAAGEGQGLPRFDDFRRNAPQTQRLLLRRPAQRAGLALPPPAKASPSPSRVAKPRAPAPANSAPLAIPEVAAPKVPSSLSGCTLQVGAIVCGRNRFTLHDNLPNKALAPTALTAANQLHLPPVPHYSSHRALHQYLQRAYAEYLQKMQFIGLAGSTLTYSKFYYIFEEVHGQGRDFVQRFTAMYTYLKKDKRTIAIAPRHRKKIQPGLDQCQAIGTGFVVCDQQGTNWVYQRL